MCFGLWSIKAEQQPHRPQTRRDGWFQNWIQWLITSSPSNCPIAAPTTPTSLVSMTTNFSLYNLYFWDNWGARLLRAIACLCFRDLQFSKSYFFLQNLFVSLLWFRCTQKDRPLFCHDIKVCSTGRVDMTARRDPASSRDLLFYLAGYIPSWWY